MHMAPLDNARGERATDSEAYQYWAFISYSHADSAWARWLHAALENYRIPARLVGRDGPAGAIPKKLFPVFRDRDELAGSSDLGPELQKALRRSRFQIVIASPNAARSRWVNEEIKYFKSLGRSSRVLGLIVDGEPNASDQDEPARECFPEALRFQVGADGHVTGQPAEPIAADARKTGDGKSNALLKLIAGIIGVGFNELRQRELQARNRRLAALASVATAVSAVTLVLAVVAYQARNDALRRQQQAEDLLQFMLGDLRDKLEPIGKLAILDAVGAKAMDYFATLDRSDLTDTALASRATALRQIGSVRTKQGDMAGAQAAYREALKLDEELVLRHPQDTAYIRNVAESVYSVGYGHYVKGETELARPWLERYEALARQLVALQPGETKWQALVVDAQQNLGALAFARKDLPGAEGIFRSAIDRQVELINGAPDNTAYLETLAALHGWLWSIENDRRDWPKALEQAAKQAELQRRLLNLAPDNANYRYGLASAGVRVLRAESRIRSLAPDAPVLRETLRVTDELVALDPENVEFANLRIVAFNFLVEAHLAVDKFNAAEAAAQQALQLARQTYQRATANVQALRGLLLLLSQTAKLGLLRNDRAAARASVREGLALPVPAEFDAIQAQLRLDLGLTEWGLAAGTAEAAAIRERVAESLKRVEAAGAKIKPELMLRYSALQGDLKQVADWLTKLTDSERRHPFVREFCRANPVCAAPTG
jgi:eukaryotic-like serine/threonine-protein kinase